MRNKTRRIVALEEKANQESKGEKISQELSIGWAHGKAFAVFNLINNCPSKLIKEVRKESLFNQSD